MSMRDDLMKMVEAAGKATPGPRCVQHNVSSGRIVLRCARNPILIGSLSGGVGAQQLDDYEFIAGCSPARIKALAEVAMAAERIRSVQCDTTWNALSEALERLGKAVGQ